MHFFVRQKLLFGVTLWLTGCHTLPVVTLFFLCHRVTYRTLFILIFKHSPVPTICLNHSNPQKINMWWVLFKARAGRSRNTNFHRELVLRNVSFEISASYGIWTLFTIGDYITSLMFYPFGHTALQTVIN